MRLQAMELKVFRRVAGVTGLDCVKSGEIGKV